MHENHPTQETPKTTTDHKNTAITDSHRFCIAPMLDWTDRHARYFLRLISKHSRLYTEMVTTGAIIHGDRNRHLDFDAFEQPVALQLGGSSPEALAEACRIAEDYAYNEINLNIGCPSDRVQSGMFGACLMRDAVLVKECINAMQSTSSKLITVKCRTGVDNDDSFEFLHDFIQHCHDAQCHTFIIHARKAWLSGLSPKQNREIPPLHYERVHQLKQLYPSSTIVINGGLTTLPSCHEQLQRVDGVMMGREAYHNPFILADVDEQFYDKPANMHSRHDIITQLLPYIEAQCSQGVKFHHISRHVLGLFNGLPGARGFRRYISENASKTCAGPETLEKALEFILPPT